MPVHDGLQQAWIFLGIVFQIGVLDQHDVARGGGETGAQRRALALVHLVEQHFQVRIRLSQLVQHFPRAVAGTVVHEQDFLFHADVDRPHEIDDLGNRRRFVVDGDHDG